MHHLPRRFLIILFALLQCLAPLLHAHASMAGHGGVHLPGWVAHGLVNGLANGAADHVAPLCQDADHLPPQEAIGVASSLEARDTWLPSSPASLPPPIPALDPRVAIPWVPHAVDGPPPLLTSRRTPLPCAPPRV